MNHGRHGAVCNAPASQECGSLPGAFGHNQPNKEAVARLVWFRRKTDMDMTKFFTEQVMSGSRGEASDEATSAEQGHDHDAHDLPLRIFRLVPVP